MSKPKRVREVLNMQIELLVSAEVYLEEPIDVSRGEYRKCLVDTVNRFKWSTTLEAAGLTRPVLVEPRLSGTQLAQLGRVHQHTDPDSFPLPSDIPFKPYVIQSQYGDVYLNQMPRDEYPGQYPLTVIEGLMIAFYEGDDFPRHNMDLYRSCRNRLMPFIGHDHSGSNCRSIREGLCRAFPNSGVATRGTILITT